jgi:hypothetical protein
MPDEVRAVIGKLRSATAGEIAAQISQAGATGDVPPRIQ